MSTQREVQAQLSRIEQKLDALIEALAADDTEEIQGEVGVSLDGEPLGRERDQTKGLG